MEVVSSIVPQQHLKKLFLCPKPLKRQCGAFCLQQNALCLIGPLEWSATFPILPHIHLKPQTFHGSCIQNSTFQLLKCAQALCEITKIYDLKHIFCSFGKKKLFYMLWINRGISERQDDGTNMSVLLTDWCLHGYSFSAAKLGLLDCLAKYSCNSSKLFQPGQCKATESWMSLFTC